MAAALLLLLVAGCGLPLSSDVQVPGAVPAQQRAGGDIQVLPPGPRDDATADQIVSDFYGAQSNPAGRHASAREFLAPEFRDRWSDVGPVRVFDPALEVSVVEGAPGTVSVIGQQVGRIAADGSFAPDRAAISETVRLRQGARGRWLITSAPAGLLLSTADRDQSFTARNIYYLARAASAAAAPTHLVPDQVFLPADADTPEALVRRLLAGPSRALGDSVGTAFPPGTAVQSVRPDSNGLITVDLSPQAAGAVALRDQMSAQLVWTLRGLGSAFLRLRLRSGGKDLFPDGRVFDRNDWASYDPDGLPSRATVYYISGRRLRVLDPAPGPAADAVGHQTVDAAAVSPRGGTFALVTGTGRTAELSTGPPTGPFTVQAHGVLTSPTWGSGEQGLWYLDRGRVMLSPLTGPAVRVSVAATRGLGAIVGIRVSRDGARVAMIATVDATRRLLLGRVRRVGGDVQIVGLRSIAPDLTGVRDLSWDGATSLVVLGRVSEVTAAVRVAVDGSSVQVINRVGLEQSDPQSIAAAPDRPLIVAATLADEPVLFRDAGVVYTREARTIGYRPFYAG